MSKTNSTRIRVVIRPHGALYSLILDVSAALRVHQDFYTVVHIVYQVLARRMHKLFSLSDFV